MNVFEQMTLRLKQQMNCNQDKEVAAALGLSPRAFSGRKKRGTFPKTKLYELVAKKPELSIDVQYILTGSNTRPAKANANTRLVYLMARQNQHRIELRQKVIGIVLNHEHRELIACSIDLPKFAPATGKQAEIEILIKRIIKVFYECLGQSMSISGACDYIRLTGLLDEYSKHEQQLEVYKND